MPENWRRARGHSLSTPRCQLMTPLDWQAGFSLNPDLYPSKSPSPLCLAHSPSFLQDFWSLRALQGQIAYPWVLQSPDLTMLLPDSCCIPQCLVVVPSSPPSPYSCHPLPGLLYLLIFSSCFFNLAAAAQPSDLPQGRLVINLHHSAAQAIPKDPSFLLL